jgi:hypothetical protein
MSGKWTMFSSSCRCRCSGEVPAASLSSGCGCGVALRGEAGIKRGQVLRVEHLGGGYCCSSCVCCALFGVCTAGMYWLCRSCLQ